MQENSAVKLSFSESAQLTLIIIIHYGIFEKLDISEKKPNLW